jgi:anti-sigma factor ChrR (cupin superfamily)
MLLNSDFSQRAIVTPDDYQWIPSPQPGVERLMLDRIGREQARATSLVRYAPGSKFPAHSHPGGEEILVLDGIFTENGSTILPAGICAARTVLLTSPQVATAQPFSSSCARCLPMSASRSG